MIEQEQNSQLSALFDDQLPPEQADLVIRRALRDEALRAKWGRYALIGACMRNEPIHADTRLPDVAGRVSLMLAAEAEHPATGAVAMASAPQARRGWAMFGRGAMGGAIAAGVAAVSLFIVREMDAPVAAQGTQMAQVQAPAEVIEIQPAVATLSQAPALLAVNDTPPPSYTTPVDNSPNPRINGRLASMAVAHSQVAASTMRIIPMSVVMNGSYDISGAVDMTEAEIQGIRGYR